MPWLYQADEVSWGFLYVIILNWQYIKADYTNICLFLKHYFTPPSSSWSKRFNILSWNHESPLSLHMNYSLFFLNAGVQQWQCLLNQGTKQGVTHYFLKAMTRWIILFIGAQFNLPVEYKSFETKEFFFFCEQATDFVSLVRRKKKALLTSWENDAT